MLYVFSAFAGGVSGGGGGTTNPAPASLRQIEGSLRRAKFMLLAWLNREESEYQREKNSASESDIMGTLLFDSQPNVFEIISRLNIETKAGEPCLDQDLNPVDGSAVISRPNIICISTFNLAAKLSEYNYEYETTALVMHEISHLLGANEVMANHIQKSVLRDLLRTSFDDLNTSVGLSMGLEVSSMLQSVHDFQKNVISKNVTCEEAKTFTRIEVNYIATLRDIKNIYPLRASEMERMRAYHIKYMMLENYLCANDPLAEPSPGHFEAKIARCFRDAPEVEAGLCLGGLGLENYLRVNDVFIRKITSPEQLNLEFEDFYQSIMAVQTEISQLTDARFELVPSI